MTLITNTEAIEAVNNGEDIPEQVLVDGEVAATFNYVRTDAWRGYYDAVPAEGWRKLADESNWVTGDWEDAPSGHSSSEVQAHLKELARRYEREGKDVLAIFAPTSNVFSTGFDVLVRESS